MPNFQLTASTARMQVSVGLATPQPCWVDDYRYSAPTMLVSWLSSHLLRLAAAVWRRSECLMNPLPQQIPGSDDIPDGSEVVALPLVRLLAVHVALREWEGLDSSGNSSVSEATMRWGQ